MNLNYFIKRLMSSKLALRSHHRYLLKWDLSGNILNNFQIED